MTTVQAEVVAEEAFSGEKGVSGQRYMEKRWVIQPLKD